MTLNKNVSNGAVIGSAHLTRWHPALPRPFAILHQLLQAQLREEFLENLAGGFLDHATIQQIPGLPVTHANEYCVLRTRDTLKFTLTRTAIPRL